MKVIFFTNIIPPYRIDLFNSLERNSKDSNFDFEVYFMRVTESNRTWKINLSDINFKHTIGNGFYAYFKGLHLHFNPLLILNLALSKKELVLGASWNNLNTMVLVILKKLCLISNKLSIWTEANHLTIHATKRNIIRDILRKFVFSNIDGRFLIPGKMSELALKKWGINPKNISYLPNLVSSKSFSRSNIYNNNTNAIPNALIIARLEEKYKGILNFLQSIGVENIRKIIIKIAGSGSSLGLYKKFIEENELHENIILLGDLDKASIIKEYESTSFFILPSFSDPSPLVVVEACKMGLPLLISNRCGNHFEAVTEGVNGFTFDPYNTSDVRNKFEAMLSRRNEWDSFSSASKKISQENFDEDKILQKLIKDFNTPL